MTKILHGNSLRWHSKFARVLTVMRGLIAIFRVRNCKTVHLFTINMLMEFVSYRKIDVGIQNICCSEFPSWHLVYRVRVCVCALRVRTDVHTPRAKSSEALRPPADVPPTVVQREMLFWTN